MTTPLTLVILIPFLSALPLALIANYRVSAAANIVAMFATLVAGLALPFGPREAGDYFILDEVNILFLF